MWIDKLFLSKCQWSGKIVYRPFSFGIEYFTCMKWISYMVPSKNHIACSVFIIISILPTRALYAPHSPSSNLLSPSLPSSLTPSPSHHHHHQHYIPCRDFLVTSCWDRKWGGGEATARAGWLPPIQPPANILHFLKLFLYCWRSNYWQINNWMKWNISVLMYQENSQYICQRQHFC